MKVKIENFGPVECFEFDSSKSMHLIVGINNIGKSYALTAYYCAMKTFIEFSKSIRRYYYHLEIIENHSLFDKKITEDLFAKLKEKKTTDIDVKNIFFDAARTYISSTIAEIFTHKIRSSFHDFDSIANQFSQSKLSRVSFDLGGLSFALEGDLNEFKVTDVEFNYNVHLRTIKQNRASVKKNGNFVIYKNSSDKNDDTLLKIRYNAILQTVECIHDAAGGFSDISYLPASRSGLYQALSAFGLIVAELSKNRSFITSKIELPGISGQLSDYFIKLAGISEADEQTNSSFEEIAGKIEQTVLKGKIEYDYEKKKIHYIPDNTTLKLDLSATSSMVSEIGPIVAYIRHILSTKREDRKRPRYLRQQRKEIESSKQILIIEEPEAHLHPENQIKMTELYSDLTKVNVNVIMTSHSNYVFNKLSNIVIKGTLSPEEVRCDLFEMTSMGSVGVEQLIDDLGIDDSNFVDASEGLLNEKIELISKSFDN